MKNTIQYYYHLIIDDILNKNNDYYFQINNNYYVFTKFSGNLSRTLEIYTFLKQYNIYTHEIIPNVMNNIITSIEDQTYILLKYVEDHNIIDLDKIINYQITTSQKIDLKKIITQWCEKIDYYEYQVNQYGKRYPKIRDSISYYIGMSETAIALSKEVNYENIYVTTNHERVYTNEIVQQLYNPLNLIFDSRTRDISEYIKQSFFSENYISISTIFYYTNILKFSSDEYILFLVKLLYPTYYFDQYDKIIQGLEDEQSISKITNKHKEYEKYVKEIYAYIKKISQINVEWLN